MKKGFTLIELLAVIVILAIIALIATPIIINIIENAREESEKRSVELYASAVKNAIAGYQLTHPNAPTSVEQLDIDYDGNVECTTTEIYEDGNIYLAGCTVNGSSNTYKYGANGVEKEELQTPEEPTQKPDPEPEEPTPIAKLCTANTTLPQAYIWTYGGDKDPSLIESYEMGEMGLLASEEGAYAKAVAYTCNFIDGNESNDMTFFVLSESGDSVTLISGSNLGETVAWSEDGDNHINDPEEIQAFTAKAALEERIENWTKLTEEQKATIKLPTKEQIEEVEPDMLNTWLYSHTTDNIAYGYWTASPCDDTSYSAWYVTYEGRFESDQYVDYADLYGVRPVITLSKSLIN